MPDLKTAIDGLARQFAAGVLAAIRSASLEDLLSSGPDVAGRSVSG